jgi:hypothetical protein
MYCNYLHAIFFLKIISMLQEWQSLITIDGYTTYIIVDNFQNPSI